jgi:hypothetical protein
MAPAPPRRSLLAAVAALVALALPSAAAAAVDANDEWLPSPDGASWTWAWSDSQYQQTRTKERYTFVSRAGSAFRLEWTTEGLDNPPDAAQSSGIIDFKREDSGLVNLNWSATPPPPQFPILCASTSGCGNSVAGAYFMLIWGTRSPTLAEPLLRGTRWNSVGGANNDVSSANRYVGLERVVVPAFPSGVIAAKVESDVTQAGALGDPYGSGIRTVWWVRGVGPVRIGFRHAGGAIQEAELVDTNLTPRAAPPDVNYMPLGTGDEMTFRWRNTKHMKRWAKQQFTVAQVVNNTARVDVKNLSGPIAIRGSYVLASRLSGITNVAANTKAASRAKFPALGPRSQPRDRRRHFFSPFDLMEYGFNPIIPAYPSRGESWKGTTKGPDYRAYGVTGTTKVLGIRRVRTPAGRFRALLVRSDLVQKGFRFGSGRRLTWFAPDKGLVKLVFRHRDGSVSTVQRLR